MLYCTVLLKYRLVHEKYNRNRNKHTMTFIELRSHGYIPVPSLWQNSYEASEDDWTDLVGNNRVPI